MNETKMVCLYKYALHLEWKDSWKVIINFYFIFFFKAEHTKPKSSEKRLTVTEGDQSKYPEAKVITVALETEP